jgi:hypothetical protein
MPTSCNTHDYDGKLREKWFEMRPMLIEKYLPNCFSFDDTIKQIEEWLDRKYFNVKRIGRARRSIKILTTQRKSNFDYKNDIDVHELLPILWDKVKNQEDIHDTFYEQLCDITGGSCSQGRSTRLFQFLFLFDLPTDTEQITTEQQLTDKNLPKTTTDNNSCLTSKEQISLGEQQSHVEEKLDTEKQSPVVEKIDAEQQSPVDEKAEEGQQPLVDEKPEEGQQSQTEQKLDQLEQINSSNVE